MSTINKIPWKTTKYNSWLFPFVLYNNTFKFCTYMVIIKCVCALIFGITYDRIMQNHTFFAMIRYESNPHIHGK